MSFMKMLLMVVVPLVLLLSVLGSLASSSQQQGRPHVVVVIIDDLGWADVGFRDPDMATPVMDKLAREGVILNSSYMQQVCTPSRAAFLSGYYPFRLGLQNSVLTALTNGTMPLEYRLFPQDLKDLGYSSHFVGKWHLGFCDPRMTPTYRGFDTFYGTYNGKSDHFTHLSKWNGYDLQDNKGHGEGRTFSADRSGDGVYSTNLFTDRAVDIIRDHDPADPLFLVLSYLAVHGPVQVPREYISNYCSHVRNETRRKHCAMTAAVDEGIGQVVKELIDTGIYDDLILLVTSDNGGPIKLGSSNWPLRGSKITLWEGGTRVMSFLHSKRHLTGAPYTWSGLMHAVDWYPTLMSAVGHQVDRSAMDGVDNWNSIVTNGPSARTGFVYNIDDEKNMAAIRSGRYKLVFRTGGKPDAWYNPPAGVENNRTTPRRRDYQLYDLEDDPEELHDLSVDQSLGQVLEDLKQQLQTYRAQAAPSQIAVKVSAGKPNKHGGLWVSGWC